MLIKTRLGKLVLAVGVQQFFNVQVVPSIICFLIMNNVFTKSAEIQEDWKVGTKVYLIAFQQYFFIVVEAQ
ncbi:MAG: hypothetical protein ABIP80_03590 [Ferruginibacter sp.]